MRSIGVLIVRLVVGGLLAGHGAQKLFGWFGGPGLSGTEGWLAGMRLRPAGLWARLAGGSELGGGLLTALGLFNPIGPITAIGAMTMAWAKVHPGRPVWVTAGGPELPMTNIAVLSALTIAGPGRLSLDGLLGIHVSRWKGLAALLAVLAAVWVGARREITDAASDAADAMAGLADAAAGMGATDRPGQVEPLGFEPLPSDTLEPAIEPAPAALDATGSPA